MLFKQNGNNISETILIKSHLNEMEIQNGLCMYFCFGSLLIKKKNLIQQSHNFTSLSDMIREITVPRMRLYFFVERKAFKRTKGILSS